MYTAWLFLKLNRGMGGGSDVSGSLLAALYKERVPIAEVVRQKEVLFR